MHHSYGYVFRIVLLFSALSSLFVMAQSPGVSPRDCAEMKYITGVWMSAGGTQLAYLIKSPSVDKNLNEYRLYVKDASDVTLSAGKLLMTGVEMSDIQWFDNDRRIALLASIEGVKQLVSVDTDTGTAGSLFPTQENIDSFSMDATGDTVAYSISDSAIPKQNGSEPTKDQLADGYRISFEEQEEVKNDGFGAKSIYLRHRDARGTWAPAQALSIENPFTHVKTTHLAYARNLSVSPNGKKIVLTYITDGIPADWGKNPFVQLVKRSFTSLELPVLFDVDSGKTSLAFKMIVVYSKPVWSRDSQSFFLNVHAPIGSHWESDDIRDGLISTADVNMFEVNAASGSVEEVLRHVPEIAYHYGPMFLLPNGDIVVRGAENAIVRLHNLEGAWSERSHISLPKRAEDQFEIMTSNSVDIFGVHETVTSPENLFRYRSGQAQISLLTNLNAQFRTLRSASVEPVRWTTTEGLNVSGFLFVPPDYVPGRRYPLVIQTKGDSGWFACDSGANHDPSFAPQPIASSGIMYLARSFDENSNLQQEVNRRPTGYPGGISEAVQAMDIWDSAVDALDKRGLVDPSKVGIIGFSRTGWHVEYALVHSRIRYAAATVTDNVQYSLSDYWLIPGFAHASEQMYGGPPYGETLENWQKYSISFNLDKVHTPVLMEEMGSNVHDDVPHSVPLGLAVRYEIAKGLMALGKPVELYYYPDEGHQLDHPRARLATMQRNLDWYRFWLQGYEDADPSKKGQYERWEALRGLQQHDSASQSRAAAHPSLK
jgi:dipeptidyl aminopeptidase/acylaminoacyl peptidase